MQQKEDKMIKEYSEMNEAEKRDERNHLNPHMSEQELHDMIELRKANENIRVRRG